MEHPIFFCPELLLSRRHGVRGEPARRDGQHPSRRARRQSALGVAARSQSNQAKGGIHMAKKAKGAKKKAAKKR